MIRNNKGVAMVTVLIAVMFVGMLATSLAYMSYNNYLTKSTRWTAENNFYYDEFALDELTCVIRDEAFTKSEQLYAAAAEDAKPDKMTDYIKELAKTAGVPTGPAGTPGVETGNYSSNFTGEWNPDTFNQFFQNHSVTATQTGVTIKVEVSDLPGRTEPIYQRKRKEIRFKNVKITTTDAKGFTSVIHTDIVIPSESSSSNIKVNDFSLISDNRLDWEQGGVCHFGGNLFCIDNAKSNNHTGTALTVGGGAQMTLGGKKSLIVGNVVVKGQSKLFLYNDVTITGTVQVEAGSRVEFNGTGCIIGGISGVGLGPQGKVVGDYEVDAELTSRANALFDGSTAPYSNGLAAALADDVDIPIGVKADGKLDKISFDAANDTKFSTSSFGAIGKQNGYNSFKHQPLGYSSASNPMVYYRPNSDNTNGNEASNALVLMAATGQKIRGKFTNSTIIAPGSSSSQKHSGDPMEAAFLTKLSDNDYYICLNTLVGGANQAGVNFGRNQVNLATGNMNTFNSVKNSAASNPNIYVETYDHNSPEERYMVYDKSTDTAYVPWGYFLKSNADEVIGVAFNEIRNKNDSGGKYKIVYENWVKE